MKMYDVFVLFFFFPLRSICLVTTLFALLLIYKKIIYNIFIYYIYSYITYIIYDI